MALRPIFYDLETTGIEAKEERICEIAAFDPVLGRSFESFVNPGRPIPKETIAIHGITDEMVKEAPTFSEVGKAFIDFCQGEVVLIAHNNDNFDYLFLKHETKRSELKLPAWPTIDSLKWARKYRPDLPKHNLVYLRTVFNIEENRAHRALNDVITLHKVFSAMVDDLPFETILSLMSEEDSSLPAFMPFGKYRGQPINKLPPDYVRWLQKEGALDKKENAQLKEALIKAKLLT